jgi:hypothetical protein
MQVLAQRLTGDVSLLLTNDGTGWRFSRWMRAHDEALLPAPPPVICERHFASPDAATAFFRELLNATPPMRDILTMESEREMLRAQIKDDDLAERWQAAKQVADKKPGE